MADNQTRLDSEPTEPIRATYSSMTLHRKCPEAWRFKYLDRLERLPDGPAPALEFGSWFHAVRAADRLVKGRAEKTLLVDLDTITTTDDGPTFDGDTPPEAIIEGAALWWGGLSDEQRDIWMAWLGQVLPARLEHAYRGWKARWGDDSANESVLAVELGWERSLPLTSPARPVRLFGFIDELYEDRKRRLVVVRDCKTAKDVSAVSALDELMDSQVQVYGWGVMPQCEAWGIEKPRAVSFDRVRSTAPKQPQVTKSGKLSKAVSDFDLATYLAWCAEGVPFEGLKKDGSGAGVYLAEQGEIERLSSREVQDKWFRRTLTPMSANVMRAHLRAAADTVEDIEHTRERVKVHGEAARNLVMQTCRYCDFADLCRASIVGGPQGEYPLEEYGLRVRAS